MVIGRVVRPLATPRCPKQPKLKTKTNWCFARIHTCVPTQVADVKVVNREARDTVPVIPISRGSRLCSVAGVERRILRQAFCGAYLPWRFSKMTPAKLERSNQLRDARPASLGPSV